MNKNPKELKYNNATMLDAILGKDKNFVQECLKNGVSVNVAIKKEGKNYTTFLILAVSADDEEIVKMLLAAGADPAAIDNEGKTALHHAAYTRKVKCVAMLVNFQYKNSKVLQELVASKRNGETPFEYALKDAMGGDESLALLAKFETEITKEKLNKIVSFGFIGTLKVVLEKFKDINLGELLLTAAQNHRFQIVKLLTEKGTNPNYQDQQGNSALHFAVVMGFSIEQWLENANKPDRPLSEYLDLKSSKATITTLLQSGAKVNLQNNYGNIPLHNACNYMLKYTAFVHHDNLRIGLPKVIGRIAKASLKIECLEILILLVQNDADFYLKNKAQEHGFEIISAQLKKVNDNLTALEAKKVNELINLMSASEEKQETASSSLTRKKEENNESEEESEEEGLPINFLGERDINSENFESLMEKFLKKSSSQAQQLGKSMQEYLQPSEGVDKMKKLTGSYYGYKWFLRDQNLKGEIQGPEYETEKKRLRQIENIGWLEEIKFTSGLRLNLN